MVRSRRGALSHAHFRRRCARRARSAPAAAVSTAMHSISIPPISGQPPWTGEAVRDGAAFIGPVAALACPIAAMPGEAAVALLLRHRRPRPRRHGLSRGVRTEPLEAEGFQHRRRRALCQAGHLRRRREVRVLTDRTLL